MARHPIAISRRVGFLLIILGILLIFSELGAYLTIRFVQSAISNAGAGGILLGKNSGFPDEVIEQYFKSRNPVLGWPTPAVLESEHYDPAGARPSPAYPYPQPACVAVFGDSFTRSTEVNHAQAWPHVLSQALGCRVANFGVGGYGTDQAYLRFTMTDVRSASVVILGLFPENVERNVNQYRGFVTAGHNLLFKPRFVLKNGELSVIPIIEQDDFDYGVLLERPESFLAHEYFLPDSTYGPVTIRFPYTLTALRALFHPKALAVLSGKPTWVDLYKPGHESNAFEVTAAILRKFVDDVHKLNKKPIIYVYTNARSVQTFLESGVWPYQSILTFMDRNKLPYVHFGEKLKKFIELSKICDILAKDSIFGCTGHYTPEGYRMVAQTVYDYVKARDLLPRHRKEMDPKKGIDQRLTGRTFIDSGEHP